MKIKDYYRHGELDGLDIAKEADLIINKKSKLSSRLRNIVLHKYAISLKEENIQEGR